MHVDETEKELKVRRYFEIRAEQKRKSKYNCVWIDTRNKITGEQRQVRRDYFNVSCGEWTENFVPCSLPPEEERFR